VYVFILITFLQILGHAKFKYITVFIIQTVDYQKFEKINYPPILFSKAEVIL